MKNSTLITGALVIGGLFVLASTTFAGYGQGSQSGYNMGMRGGSGFSHSGTMNPNYATYGTNIVRNVTNIANGVEITMTTTDPATLEHMKAMLTQNQIKTSPNSLIKTERTALSNGTKLTITSTDPATIKLIQDRAATAKSGAFGGGMNGKGHGQGKGTKGQGRGCLMNQ